MLYNTAAILHVCMYIVCVILYVDVDASEDVYEIMFAYEMLHIILIIMPARIL